MSLKERDSSYIWHPFDQMKGAIELMKSKTRNSKNGYSWTKLRPLKTCFFEMQLPQLSWYLYHLISSYSKISTSLFDKDHGELDQESGYLIDMKVLLF
ncbi:MAG: hypothetical protein ACJ0QO_02000 [Parvicellaceae bacterium]